MLCTYENNLNNLSVYSYYKIVVSASIIYSVFLGPFYFLIKSKKMESQGLFIESF